MTENKFKYIYGPVSSWRLGRSLGIDPLSPKKGKICTFNCSYCQLGRAENFETERKVFVPTSKIIKEIKTLPSLKIDYITLSGCGEPTLARNLGDIIRKIRKIRKEKIAVITNSSLIYRKDVQKDLMLADFIMAKLDASSLKVFKRVNSPMDNIKFNKIVSGMKKLKTNYRGKFALQIMFVDGNKKDAKRIVALSKKINPDEIQINTPLRPCEEEPISKEELNRIESFFKGTNYISVYSAKRRKAKPISTKASIKRRGEI